jgi:hypothetical protein
MAQIVGGIGSSHSPRLATVYDRGGQQDPAWAPIFDGYAPAKDWLRRVAPDLLILIYNDHVNQFFFDAYPTFALGGTAKRMKAGASATCPILPAIPISAGISLGR